MEGVSHFATPVIAMPFCAPVEPTRKLFVRPPEGIPSADGKDPIGSSLLLCLLLPIDTKMGRFGGSDPAEGSEKKPFLKQKGSSKRATGKELRTKETAGSSGWFAELDWDETTRDLNEEERKNLISFFSLAMEGQKRPC